MAEQEHEYTYEMDKFLRTCPGGRPTPWDTRLERSYRIVQDDEEKIAQQCAKLGLCSLEIRGGDLLSLAQLTPLGWQKVEEQYAKRYASKWWIWKPPAGGAA